MPELPDIDVYVHVLNARLRGKTLDEIRLGNPFVLRTVDPPVAAASGRTATTVRRVGKRVAIGLRDDLWLVIHLMIAGRLHWQANRPALTAKNRLAAFDFEHGTLLLTEAGSKKRASLCVVHGDAGLERHNPGGVEPLECSLDTFRITLRRENHTLKRALTDPQLFSGIGNAYSDEILHAARLSPVQLSRNLDDAQVRTLYEAMQQTLHDWRSRLLDEAAGEMPRKVTAFRNGMSVHGRFGMPCPVCGNPVQRIRYKTNETNYCASCQTGSRLLKDRSLSRLLKKDWPKDLDEL